jgi:LacI family transcriptional regulator
LVSFDDIDLFRLSKPMITAIAQPLDAIGEAAVHILLEEIDGPGDTGPKQKILPVELILRGSCGSKALAAMPGAKKSFKPLPQEMEI